MMNNAQKDIDSYPSKQFFFVLTEDRSCLSIQIAGSYKNDTILHDIVSQKICFIIDKPVIIPALGKTEYYEVGRNYSPDWDLNETVSICSSPNNPFQKITKGIYRIRCTSFSSEVFDVKITLDTGHAGFFLTYDESVYFLRSLNEQRK
jgi:hypothetical protein